MLSVTILGNNSAVPAFNRHPTSQLVVHDGAGYLVDCGEGTQIQMIKYKVRRGRIGHIFISHLHGDHYFGLAGLLNSFNLLSHKQPLHVWGPPQLQQIIELQLGVAETEMCYPLHFHAVTEAGVLVETNSLRITAFPTTHRIPCFGFLFEEQTPKRKLLIEKVRSLRIPMTFYSSLQQGLDYITTDGETILNREVTTDPEPGRRYAFCSDTRYDENILPYIQNADAIYHETTYLKNLQNKAGERFHSTTTDAATIAQKAGVKKLLIGHFSSKYANLEPFAEEAKEVFANTQLAIEGETYEV